VQTNSKCTDDSLGLISTTQDAVVAPVQATKEHGGVNVYLLSFLTSPLDKWSCPGRVTPQEGAPGTQWAPQPRNFSPLPENEHRYLGLSSGDSGHYSTKLDTNERKYRLFVALNRPSQTERYPDNISCWVFILQAWNLSPWQRDTWRQTTTCVSVVGTEQKMALVSGEELRSTRTC